MLWDLRSLLAGLALCLFNHTSVGVQPESQWTGEIFCPNGVDGAVYAASSWDNGSETVLYIGGDFDVAGCESGVGNIVRWDGSQWSPLVNSGYPGVNSRVRAMLVFDDGTGPALFVAGDFGTAGGQTVNRIAKWDGSSWSSLSGTSGTGLNGTAYALAVFDDGTGPALYAGGSFTTAGGEPAAYVARWDGTEWAALNGPAGESLGGTVYALEVFNDGTGPALYAGGSFETADGHAANNIARWDGVAWTSLSDSGGTGVDGAVYALEAFDDGNQRALYAGGDFNNAAGKGVNHIAKWNGAAWSGLTGTDRTGVSSTVSALAMFDDGTGRALYAGGSFQSATGEPMPRIAKWTGTNWERVGASSAVAPEDGDTVYTLLAFDDGNQRRLLMCGLFSVVDGHAAANIAAWSDAQWSPISTGKPGGLAGPTTHGYAKSFTVFDDGTGPDLYAGGKFVAAGGRVALGIARWDGASWRPLEDHEMWEGALTVSALAAFDDGSGPALYAARMHGDIVRWDGVNWSAVGQPSEIWDNNIGALLVFDDGNGDALYASANATGGSGPLDAFVTRWNGTSWSTVGSEMNGHIYALASFDDGTGPALYAAGAFTTAAGQPANRIAKWNGISWIPLGSGIESTNGPGIVRSLAVFNDGSGPALYAAGSFNIAGGQPAPLLARWDGQSWSPVDTDLGGTITSLMVHDDGSGDALYLGGIFTKSGEPYISNIARWDGVEFSSLGTGAHGAQQAIYALASFEDAAGPSLYAGGPFNTLGGVSSSRIARWGRPVPVCSTDVNADGLIDAGDLNIVLANFGQSTSTGDTNADGTVDLADLNAILAEFGSDCP